MSATAQKFNCPTGSAKEWETFKAFRLDKDKNFRYSHGHTLRSGPKKIQRAQIFINRFNLKYSDIFKKSVLIII